MTVTVTPITTLAAQGRWRTEAMRSHSGPRVLWIARGQGRVTLAGQTRGYGPNNLIYIPPGTLHGYEVRPQSWGLMVALQPSAASEWPEEPVHLRLRDVHLQKELAKLVETLHREATSEGENARLAARMHAGLLAVFTLRQMEQAGDHALPETPATRIADAYSALIARDFSKPMGVAHYAAALGVTPTHLTRACRAACGRTALSLLNDRILFEARRRLSETDTPVARIAADLGYSSPAYFSRAFSAATGQSPTAFRRASPKSL